MEENTKKAAGIAAIVVALLVLIVLGANMLGSKESQTPITSDQNQNSSPNKNDSSSEENIQSDSDGESTKEPDSGSNPSTDAQNGDTTGTAGKSNVRELPDGYEY